MKDSYIMHCDYGNHFELLTDAELGRLIRDVNNYVKMVFCLNIQKRIVF